jgi:hypothetical protein
METEKIIRLHLEQSQTFSNKALKVGQRLMGIRLETKSNLTELEKEMGERLIQQKLEIGNRLLDFFLEQAKGAQETAKAIALAGLNEKRGNGWGKAIKGACFVLPLIAILVLWIGTFGINPGTGNLSLDIPGIGEISLPIRAASPTPPATDSTSRPTGELEGISGQLFLTIKIMATFILSAGFLFLLFFKRSKNNIHLMWSKQEKGLRLEPTAPDAAAIAAAILQAQKQEQAK